jgi:uncharacterized protein YjgD (DUF1641 family)
MNNFTPHNLESPDNQEALSPKVEHGPHVKEFEEMLAPLLEEGFLAELNALKTEEEARKSAPRESAKEALIPLVDKMNFLRYETDIEVEGEKFKELRKQYKTISNAVGFINDGEVDHSR